MSEAPKPSRDTEELISWSFEELMDRNVEGVYGRFSATGPVNRRRGELSAERIRIHQEMNHCLDPKDLSALKDEVGGIELKLTYLKEVCDEFDHRTPEHKISYAVWSATETIRQRIRRDVGDQTEQREHIAALNEAGEALRQECGLTESASNDSSAE